MKIKLEDAVTEKKVVTVEKRPALYADKCDACGLVFKMSEWCGEHGRAELSGTFEDVVPGEGNIFVCTVCSFECAHEIFAKEGWKRLKGYQSYAKLGIEMARATVCITRNVLDETQLRKRWVKKGEAR